MRRVSLVMELGDHMETYHTGPENAVTAGRLAKTFKMRDLGSNGRHGLLNSRTLTKRLDRAISMGYPIVYGDHGYYVARNLKEAQPCVLQLEHLSALFQDRADRIKVCFRRGHKILGV